MRKTQLREAKSLARAPTAGLGLALAPADSEPKLGQLLRPLLALRFGVWAACLGEGTQVTVQRSSSWPSCAGRASTPSTETVAPRVCWVPWRGRGRAVPLSKHCCFHPPGTSAGHPRCHVLSWLPWNPHYSPGAPRTDQEAEAQKRGPSEPGSGGDLGKTRLTSETGL